MRRMPSGQTVFTSMLPSCPGLHRLGFRWRAKPQRAILPNCHIFFFAFSLCPILLPSQTDSIKNRNSDQVEDMINQNIELLSEQLQSEEGDLSNLTDVWNHYRKHPINLNQAKKEELEELQLLNDIQINHLLKHREKNGHLISIYELQSIEGFDLLTIRRILPFVYVSDLFHSAFFSPKEMFRHGKHEMVFRFQRTLEKQAGYGVPDSIRVKKPNSYYLGDANRYFARYRFQYNNAVSFALSGEKDAGEEFFTGTQKQGFDFYSGHVAIRNIRFVKTLVLGDYQATFGQGLTMWQGFAFGKSASPINIKRYGYGIKPYYSFDENRFFRGAAATVRYKKLEFTGLVSHKRIDANTIEGDTLANGDMDIRGVSSLETGGLHTTNSLVADKGAIGQTVFGGNAAFNNRSLHIGLTAQSTHLSKELIKSPTLYNQFDYQGKSNVVAGLDYNYVVKNVNLFGEFAMSTSAGKAFCQGIIVAPDPKLTFTAHYRNFDRNFHNLFGNAISENTLPQNEKGLYIGMEARIFRSFTLSLYLDQYAFSWIKPGVSAPSHGRDIFTQLNYTPNKKLEMYLRFRNRTRFENSDLNNAYDYPVPYVQYNYRYNLSVQLIPEIKFKTRIEYTFIAKTNAPGENGLALIQDLVYKKLKSPLAITLRYAVFDTKSYDSRVYAFENDVLYSYSVPALYYKGQRAYILINWDMTRNLELWLRLARTIYDNQTVISAGSMNEIAANHKTELKLQLRLKF